MESNKVRNNVNYYQINKEELVQAFGRNTVEEIVKDQWTQGFRKIVHCIGQLFGVRIYGKVILNNDPSSVIYINKCDLNKIARDSGLNWKGPQFVQTFIAYVRSKNLQESVKVYKDVSQVSIGDLLDLATSESRLKMIREGGILDKQDEASRKAALLQIFQDSEKMKDLLSFYYSPLTVSLSLERLESFMSDEQKMFLLSLLMSVKGGLGQEKEMPFVLGLSATRLATYFQEDSSRVERAISTEMGSYALTKIWDASEHVELEPMFQQIVDETFTVLK